MKIKVVFLIHKIRLYNIIIITFYSKMFLNTVTCETD